MFVSLVIEASFHTSLSALDNVLTSVLMSVPRAVASANNSIWRPTHTLATARGTEIRTALGKLVMNLDQLYTGALRSLREQS